MEQPDLFKAYFKVETDYYLKKLEQFNNGQKFTFNLWAGLLNSIWLFYRKMYLEGLIVIVLLNIVPILFVQYMPQETITNIFFRFIFFAFIGNYLYIRKTNKIIIETSLKYDLGNESHNLIHELQEKGGASIGSAFICFAIEIISQIYFNVYF